MKPKVYNFLHYDEARAFVKKLKLKNQFEWQQYAKGALPVKGKKPKNIPSNPWHQYKSSGWTSWKDWLSTNNLPHNQKQFPSYEAARKIVHSLELKNKAAWKSFRQELKSGSKYSRVISRNPDVYYKNKGWRGWEDWIGCKLDPFLPYEKAKNYIAKLSIKSREQWVRYDKKLLPSFIPKSPDSTYQLRKEWVSWGDFLGTGRISRKRKDYYILKELQQKKNEGMKRIGSRGSGPHVRGPRKLRKNQ